MGKKIEQENSKKLNDGLLLGDPLGRKWKVWISTPPGLTSAREARTSLAEAAERVLGILAGWEMRERRSARGIRARR